MRADEALSAPLRRHNRHFAELPPFVPRDAEHLQRERRPFVYLARDIVHRSRAAELQNEVAVPQIALLCGRVRVHLIDDRERRILLQVSEERPLRIAIVALRLRQTVDDELDPPTVVQQTRCVLPLREDFVVVDVGERISLVIDELAAVSDAGELQVVLDAQELLVDGVAHRRKDVRVPRDMPIR